LVGVVTAKPGHNTSGVMTKISTGFNVGVAFGVEHTKNDDGQFNGFGIMTPQAGGVASYGAQLSGGPGASPPTTARLKHTEHR